jgi:hypothetical protein
MRYIGRIITSAKMDDVPELIDVTQDTGSLSGDGIKIPTLIIGYRNARKICGDFNVTEWKIRDNLYWTFSKRERRSDYVADLERFYGVVSEFLSSCCGYEYVDMISGSAEKKHHIAEMFSDTAHKKIVYDTDTMCYIYYPHDGKVYGVAKSVIGFLGYDENIIRNRVDGKHSFIADDEIYRTSWPTVQKFMVPLLYYLKTF